MSDLSRHGMAPPGVEVPRLECHPSADNNVLPIRCECTPTKPVTARKAWSAARDEHKPPKHSHWSDTARVNRSQPCPSSQTARYARQCGQPFLDLAILSGHCEQQL